MTSEPLLGFDVGNSCVKAAMLDHAEPCQGELFPHGPDDAIIAWLDGLLKRTKAGRAVVSTVSPSASDRLIRALTDRGVEVELVLRSDGRLFAAGYLKHALQTPETTGVDRVLSAVAALERTPQKHVIVVDSGSAATVNLTTKDRVFRGGAIMPGFRLMGVALHRGTAALPNVSIQKKPRVLGDSTQSSLSAGVYFAVAGGVDRLIRELIESLGGDQSAVLLTGGDAELLSSGLTAPHTIVPHLVLEGLEIVVRQWREKGRVGL